MDCHFHIRNYGNARFYFNSFISVKIKQMSRRNVKKNSDGQFEKTGSWSFRFFMLAGLFAVGYISYNLFQETYKENQINKEISQLQTEIERLNQDNKNFQELVNYLQTDDFKEKEIKDKLNLVKEGEQVILVKEKDVAVKSAQIENNQSPKAEVIVNRSNYYWWWHYFFSI